MLARAQTIDTHFVHLSRFDCIQVYLKYTSFLNRFSKSPGSAAATQPNCIIFVADLVYLLVTDRETTFSLVIFVAFQYIVADIIFYSKSPNSAETVKFWLRTSFQCEIHAGIFSCSCLWWSRFSFISKNLRLSLRSHISATLLPNSTIFFQKRPYDSQN